MESRLGRPEDVEGMREKIKMIKIKEGGGHIQQMESDIESTEIQRHVTPSRARAG